MNGLLANKKIDRPKVGINYIDLNELALTENSILSSEYFEKAIIAKNKNGVSVEKNSLAFEAGLREDDIILSINNIPLDKENNLTYLIGNYQKGDSILVEYLRNNEKGEVGIEL
jgi:S1-C subfamily serine protease